MNLFPIADHLTQTSRMSDWPLSARLNKAMEELGEVATAALIMEGHITHKKLDEPLEGEVADVFICIWDVLARAYPDKSPQQLLGLFVGAVERKKEKWRDIVMTRLVAGMTHPPAANDDYFGCDNQV